MSPNPLEYGCTPEELRNEIMQLRNEINTHTEHLVKKHNDLF